MVETVSIDVRDRFSKLDDSTDSRLRQSDLVSSG